MEFDEFKQGYNQFCENWQRKGATKNAEFLFSKVRYIPSAAWAEIVEDILLNLERFPRIKDLHGAWHSWRKANSDRLISDAPEETDCSICLGVGLLEYEFEEHHRTYLGVQPCGYCENWKRHISPKKWDFVKTFRIADITDNGWKWIEPPERCTREQAIDAMDKMFDNLGTKREAAYQPDLHGLMRQDKYDEDIPF